MEKEVSESERRLLVRSKYLQKISVLLEQPYLNQKDLFAAVKNFFSEYLKIEYEFTYEELSSELKKVYIKNTLKKDIDDFLYELSESQYFTDRELERPEITENLKKFHAIIGELIAEENSAEKGKSSFFDKLFRKTKEEEKKQAAAPLQPMMSLGPLPEEFPELNTKSYDVSGAKRELDAENDLFKDSMFEGEKYPDIPDEPSLNIISDMPQPAAKKENSAGRDKRADNTWKKNESKSTRASDKQETTKKTDKAPVERGYFLLIEENNPAIIDIREHMEESYNGIFRGDLESAKSHYLQAIALYHRLSIEDKGKTYQALYELFRNLKSK